MPEKCVCINTEFPNIHKIIFVYVYIYADSRTILNSPSIHLMMRKSDDEI